MVRILWEEDDVREFEWWEKRGRVRGKGVRFVEVKIVGALYKDLEWGKKRRCNCL